MLFFRKAETPKEARERLDKELDRYHNQSNEKKQETLEKMRDYSQTQRENESALRKSTRLAADASAKATKRILNPTKEKDAYQKWKQRYKK